MTALLPRVNVEPFSSTGRPAAVYERELDASVDRIWENVLDWEHLPHLHPQAFSSVHRMSSGPDRWHGIVGIAGDDAEIDVEIDRPGLRYSTRTIAGLGAGTEILTQLFPRSARRTGIRVDFYLPWAPEEAAESLGEVYRSLYVVLWDQDEAMMKQRQRVVDAAAVTVTTTGTSLDLGPMHELARRLPVDVDLAGRRFRVVSIDDRLLAYDTTCPHLGGPLDERELDGCEAVCPWHGYRFDVRSGRSSDGRGFRLRSVAVVDCSGDGRVVLRLP